MGDDERKLFVGQLPDDIGEDEIKMIFATYGPVEDVHLLPSKDSSVKNRRASFVTYETVEAARAAIQVLNDVYKFRPEAEQPITVKVAKPRQKGGDKGGGKGWNDSYGKGGGKDSYGYDRGSKGGKGYDRGGYDNKGYGGGYDKGGYGKGSDRGGYDRGYDRKGGSWDRGGYDQGGRGGYDQGGKGYDRGGGYDRRNDGYSNGGGGGYDRGGYDRGGYDRGGKGYDRGYDRGYDNSGGKGYQDGGKGDGRRDDNQEGKLYISNLPSDIDKETLDTVFKTYGKIDNIHVMNNRGQNGQSCAFVTYANPQEAKQAIAAMEQGYEIRPGEGNILVKLAGPRKGKGDKGDKGGKGDYKGGKGDYKGKGGYAPY
eukprot:TRINITY_DN759_c0_g1_i1.p2 TRINITY_DN759_c0_g1~~TRINITY_DN759_c0_g1_i1.p2  ORF type:complete len:399 (-),score=95.14 TRINITY_DN759_c0_g1_i1:65-1171(-)